MAGPSSSRLGPARNPRRHQPENQGGAARSCPELPVSMEPDTFERMNIHEYQAKELLRKFKIPTLSGKLALNPEEAVSAAKELGGNIWVVKAQIHAGGRGKGGGIKVAKTLDEVRDFTKKMIGMQLVTPQTGPEGKKVSKVSNADTLLTFQYARKVTTRPTDFQVSQAAPLRQVYEVP